MAISGTSTDYTGRKIDLSLFPDIAVPNVPVDAKMSYPTKGITGASKLAQNFLRILLTPMGTYKSQPAYGSDFLLRLKTDPIHVPADAIQVFIMESARVADYMKGLEDDTMPDDERMGTVSFIDFTFDKTSVNISATLTTRSSAAIKFVLPIVPYLG